MWNWFSLDWAGAIFGFCYTVSCPGGVLLLWRCVSGSDAVLWRSSSSVLTVSWSVIGDHVRVQQRNPVGHQRPVCQQQRLDAAAALPETAAALQHHRRRVLLHHAGVPPLPAGPWSGGGRWRAAGGLHGSRQDVPAAVRRVRPGGVPGGRTLPAAAPLQVFHLRKLQVWQGQVSSAHALRYVRKQSGHTDPSCSPGLITVFNVDYFPSAAEWYRLPAAARRNES